eukprot:scaffold58727_cov48-Attheya_sp.AAC.2
MCGIILTGNSVGVGCCNNVDSASCFPSNSYPNTPEFCSTTCGLNACEVGSFICALNPGSSLASVADCALIAQGDCTACSGGSRWTNSTDWVNSGCHDPFPSSCGSCTSGDVCCNKGLWLGFECKSEAACNAFFPDYSLQPTSSSEDLQPTSSKASKSS